MKIEKGKLYYDLFGKYFFQAKENIELIKDSVTNKIAVHCPTNEDLDYVKLFYKNILGTPSAYYYPDVNVKLDRDGRFCRGRYIEGYHIITIDEFKKFYPKQEQDPYVWGEMPPTPVDTSVGYKETEGKLVYELDWDFVEGMAKRMASSDKYEPYNWQKPMNTEGLVDAITRHFMEIRRGRFEDEGQEFGHIFALATDLMMLHYQLKNKENC